MTPSGEAKPSGLLRRWPQIVCLVAGVLYSVWAALFIYRTSSVAVDGRRYFSLFDDAMISMRYGWNLAHGNGLVWNVGERVEGFTNPLWTMIMAIASLQGSKPIAVLLIQILGIGIVLGVAAATFVLSGRVFASSRAHLRRIAQTAAFVAVLAYYPLSFWSLMGMEAGLLTLLAVIGVTYTIDLWQRPAKTVAVRFGVIWGLAYLTRPDAALLVVLVALWLLVQHLRSHRRIDWRLAGWALGIPIAVAIGWSAFRWVYYQELLPNTYVLKMSGIPLSIRISGGAHFIAPFLEHTAPLMIIALSGLILRFSWEKLLLIACLFALVAYQIYVGGDPWPIWRMIMPAIPMLFLLAIGDLVQGAAWLAHRVSAADQPRRLSAATTESIAIAGSFLLLFALIAGSQWEFRTILALRGPAFAVESRKADMNVAATLNRALGPNATIGVYTAGLIPYYVDRQGIDFFGKMDTHVARVEPDLSGAISALGMKSVPGHNKYDLEYSLKQLRPTYSQGVVRGRDDLREWAADYYVGYQLFGTQAYFLKDSPDVDWSQLEGFPPLRILPNNAPPGD